jgi:hypothetical protein
MAATPDMIARLRRMVNEPTTGTYSDKDLGAYIERFPTIDDQGYRPFYIDQSTTPPSRADTVGWIPSYDLNAAAADIWAEKAAPTREGFDFTDAGINYGRNQIYEQYMKQSRYYLARRKPATITLSQEPRNPNRDSIYIANLPEERDY